MRTDIPVTVLGAIHLGVVVWHGDAHKALAIALPPEENAFVLVVIVVAPVVAASLLWTKPRLWMFFRSMVGAFVFGGYHHYVLASYHRHQGCREILHALGGVHRVLPSRSHSTAFTGVALAQCEKDIMRTYEGMGTGT